MIKCFFARDIIDEECSGGASVIAAGDALEGLLAGGVPDLQLDILIINFYSATAELDSNSQIVLLAESLVRELKQQARLADTCTPKYTG